MPNLRFKQTIVSTACLAGLLATASPVVVAQGQVPPASLAQGAPASVNPPLVTYADLVALTEAAPLVLRAQIAKTAVVEPARAPGLKPGQARLYVEAKTQALLLGTAPLGEALRYLVDVPLDLKGKPPKLKKQSVLLFARAGARPGELQLVKPDAQLPWSAGLEAQERGVIAELLAAGAPKPITTVREAIYVPGALAGEGETQIFLATPGGNPASITVVHRPGAEPTWSASFSEVLDPSGKPPPRDTLAWYRLACALPKTLPQGTNVSESDADKAQAEQAYARVLADLGPCTRMRR